MIRFGQFVLGVFALLLLLNNPMNAWGQEDGRAPATAFDSVNNRYLTVWEDDEGSGVLIKGKFLNPDGSDAGAEIFTLSPDRPTQGCFYGSFDSDNGNVSTPSNCPDNLNPTVAYNNGQYLIAWEVHGSANSPGTSPENQFINIFSRIVDANNLNAISGWGEGILISKVYVAADNVDRCSNGKYVCNDSEIQAWSQSKNPHVAPRVGDGGFVVTWETNKDYIGCSNSERRRGWSVYGRYIDQSFSATSTTNPPAFSVFKDDSTMEENCATLSNVDNANNPRIAFNQASDDFVIVYELARADGGRASIGAKLVTIDGSGSGQVNGGMMAGLVASVDGSSLTSPEIVSFNNNYVLFTSDGSNIRAKSFASSSISNSTPPSIDLGSGNQINPRAAGNLGSNGQGPVSGGASERLALGYEQGDHVFVAVLDESLTITLLPLNLSEGIATSNEAIGIASDLNNFVAVWGGQSSGDKVFAGFIDSDGGPMGDPPTAPGLLTPDDGVTFAPIRVYLSWTASTDPDGDDANITYNIYFGETTLPGTPQITGIIDTEFVIGPETESMTGITFAASKTYKWAIEAQDEDTDTTISVERTLNTDNSLMAWWRFDEDPNGVDCPGGDPGETVCDYSGNNNHGIPFGVPLWIMPGMPNILMGAIDFDGVDDYVDIEHSGTLDIVGANTIMAQMTPQAPPVGFENRIYTKLNAMAPLNGLNLDIPSSDNKLRYEVCNSLTTCEQLRSNTIIIPGTQYRAIAVYDLTNARIFIDGILDITSPLIGFAPGSNADSAQIGEHNAKFYNGIIDEIIILDKAISLEEIDNDQSSVN